MNLEKTIIYLKKYKKLIIVGMFVLAVILSILFFLVVNSQTETKDEEEELLKENSVVLNEQKKEAKKIKVDIKGAIITPGVYEMEEGSRVEDVIAKSGGLKEDAHTEYINLSKNLKDEMVIIIYTKLEINNMIEGNKTIRYIEKECICPVKENDACLDSNKTSNQKKENGSTSSKEESGEIGVINLNTANSIELQKLTGIGDAKAKLIIEYRNKKVFGKIEDIKNVKGIGEGIFAKIKEHITV